MSEKRICIGKISSTHGVKGLVKVLPYCEDLSLLESTLFTGETGDETINITLKNNSGKFILAEIEGINNKEDAQKTKCSLYVSRETLPEIDNKDEFYIEDLKGLNAVDEKNNPIGKLVSIQNFGAGNLIELKPASGQSYFIPFEDQYVIEVNIEEKHIILKDAEKFIIE